MNNRTTARLVVAAGVLTPALLVAAVTQRAAAHGADNQERFLYRQHDRAERR